jgi:hypothetical protein
MHVAAALDARRWCSEALSPAALIDDGGLCSPAVAVEMPDVAPGLWLWRQPHPDWSEGSDWEPEVASFAVKPDHVRDVDLFRSLVRRVGRRNPEP